MKRKKVKELSGVYAIMLGLVFAIAIVIILTATVAAFVDAEIITWTGSAYATVIVQIIGAFVCCNIGLKKTEQKFIHTGLRAAGFCAVLLVMGIVLADGMFSIEWKGLIAVVCGAFLTIIIEFALMGSRYPHRKKVRSR